VLRPLIASHKQDIIDQANEIGTADFAKHMPEYCGVISVNPTTHAKRHRMEHEEKQFDMAVLERALERAKLVSIDRVIDELGKDIEIEEVARRCRPDRHRHPSPGCPGRRTAGTGRYRSPGHAVLRDQQQVQAPGPHAPVPAVLRQRRDESPARTPPAQ
jgi:hypothetical protein